MASGIFYPAVSGDDGYIHSGGSFNNSGVGGTMGDYSGSPAETFFRFANVTIPQGSTISAAFIRFICLNPRSTTVCNLKCHMNAHDNASAPTNYAGFNALALTTGTAWNALPEWIGDTAYDTPSIITEIQSVVDRLGFVSGNAIMAVLKNNGSSTDARRDPSAVNYLSGAEKAELHISWLVEETSIIDLSSDIEALRSKWWLNTDIQAAGIQTIKYLKTFIDARYSTLSEREKFLLLRYDHTPTRNAQSVKTAKAMQFRLYNPDTAFGIDITSFKVRFDGGAWYRYGDNKFTFTKVNYREYLVYFNPPNLPYDSQITAELYCEDHRNNPGIKLEIL